MKKLWVVGVLCLLVLPGVGCVRMALVGEDTTITIEAATVNGKSCAQIVQGELEVVKRLNVTFVNMSEVPVDISFADCPKIFRGNPELERLDRGEQATFTVKRDAVNCEVSAVCVISEDPPETMEMGGPVLIPIP